jgi:hypothetical protein
MKIRITRKGTRNQLACYRPDGTSVLADLGPNLPHHDLAHYVVERTFRLTDGFFGNIARGYSPTQLSDKDVILSLGREPYRAEILARALGSLTTGACTPGQFEELVNTELAGGSLTTMRIPADVLAAMAAEFGALMNRYAQLGNGESLNLEFQIGN